MAERIQRLIATQKELSSAISHELRTPIARLRFALEMCSETNDRDERGRLWDMMGVDLDELDNLIDSSLTYARFEREQPELNLTPVELAPWIEEEVESMRILGRSLELSVDTSALPTAQQVELDLKSMPYAVTNLLRNAIKYAKEKIVVSAEVAGDRVLLHVDDDGVGIPPEERQRVFFAFTHRWLRPRIGNCSPSSGTAWRHGQRSSIPTRRRTVYTQLAVVTERHLIRTKALKTSGRLPTIIDLFDVETDGVL
jgi:two-component system sensor histidine kinase RstB